MATISFETNGKINTDWGIKNLEKAIDEGSELMRQARTPEARAKFREMTTLSDEDWRKIREANLG